MKKAARFTLALLGAAALPWAQTLPATDSASLTAAPAKSAAPPTARDSAAAIPHIDASKTTVVRGRRRNLEREGMLSQAIQPTSVVTQEILQCRNAANLSQAVSGEPGVDVLTGCSMCGFKQVEVNGLGPERTTVLVDGLPLYSTISGFYGLDGLTTAGLADIEVARGPGASLLAPGAIGGTMDVRLQNPAKPFVSADLAAGDHDWRRLSFAASSPLEDGSLGILVAGHFYGQGQRDADGNGLSESPSLKDESGMIRLNGSVFGDWNWNARVLHSRSEVFGGVLGASPQSVAASDTTGIVFTGNDVRNAYAGGIAATTEWVETTRDEAAGSLSWSPEDIGLWQLRGGWVASRQASLYEDDADYANRDHLATGDARWQGRAGAHTLTVGFDGTYEEMTSSSIHYYQNLGMVPDDFNATFLGGYAQEVWNFGHQRDLSLAARLDKAEVQWTAKSNEAQIDDWLISPRASLRWEFLEGLTARLSAGRGWRAPLTFFESDHGLLDNGYGIDVKKLEKAWGSGFSLAYERSNWNLQAGAYGTMVQNLAYIDDAGDMPVLRNDSAELPFLSLDLEGGFQPWTWLQLGLGIQHQELPDRYKSHAAVAAVETRMDGNLRLTAGPAKLYLDASWTAPRDLKAYGYSDQYNVYDDATGTASSPKRTHAPGFAVVNLQASCQVRGPLEVYAGADNLLDYTQTVSGSDSPLFWDKDGGYDVSHIWGPLRGRQLYLGLRWKS